MTNKVYAIMCMVALLHLSACNQNTEPAEPDDHGHAHEELPENRVFLAKEQLAAATIEVGNFEYRNLRSVIKTNGRLELPPQNKASLSAIMPGMVRDIFVIAGDPVKKGQRLATLEHPEYIRLQQDYLSAKGRKIYLEQEYQRQKRLYEEEISAGKKFQEVESDYLTVKAEVKGLEARLKMLGIRPEELTVETIMETIPITSPIDGFVRLIEVNIGTFVEPSQEMFEIVDIHHIHIDLLVYEKDIDKVKKGQKVYFNISNRPGTEMQAKVFAVGKAFEEEPKAVRVHAEIESDTNLLLPGMYVEARIALSEDSVQVLPEEAVVTDEGLSYIFLQRSVSDEGTVFEKVPVKTGVREAGYVEVLPTSDMAKNPSIVTSGTYYLQAHMSKSEGDLHGHDH